MARAHRGGPLTESAMQHLRVTIRAAIGKRPLRIVAKHVGCSENTLLRILGGENVSVRTVARITEAFGYTLQFQLVKKAQHIEQ